MTSAPLLWSALLLGLAGSLHCVGMCGPLVLALPRGSRGPLSHVAGRVLYNVGRAVTYAFLGALFGLGGEQLRLAGVQQGLSLALGVALIAGVLLSTRGRRANSARTWLLRPFRGIQHGIGVLMRRHTPGALLGMGLLNGLLPCGLVYVALAGALASGTPQAGALYMFVFGLGTLPAMLALGLFGAWIPAAVLFKFRRAIPFAVGVVAGLLILRGLGLDIPYLSPLLPSAPGTGACCHGS